MLEGVFIAAVTPFRNQHVDEAAAARNFEIWNSTDVAGYLVLGSTGEFVHLMFAEKVEVIRLARKYAGPDKKLIAGIGCESVYETVRLAHEAEDLGADAVMAVTPHYYKPALKPDVLRRYYLEIADQVDRPLYLYNIPQNTGVNLGVDLVRELAQHPRIQGIKDSSGRLPQLYDLLQIKGDFDVLNGNLFTLVPALMMGAQGAVLAFANGPAQELAQVYRLVRQGKGTQAMQALLPIIRLGRASLDRYGIPGLKALMALMGYDPGEPRSPFRAVPEETVREIAQAYERFKADLQQA